MNRNFPGASGWPRPDRIDLEDQLLSAAVAIPFTLLMAFIFWSDWAPGVSL